MGKAEESDSGNASIQPEPFRSYHYGQMCFMREELFSADASAEFSKVAEPGAPRLVTLQCILGFPTWIITLLNANTGLDTAL